LVNLLIRKASACWEGGAKGGTRTPMAESGVLSQVKVARDGARKGGLGTGPAELIAAAHASSFSLALSQELGLQPSALGEIVTTATVTMEHLAAGWAIISMHLHVAARLPVTQNAFIDAAVRAKTTCLISNILRVKISMNAKLDSEPESPAKGAA
jgi:osmotically inducible protein OsmC